MARRVGRNGRTHNVGSTLAWADYQIPPVMCCECGDRVTLKSGHRSYFDVASGVGRTWHHACDRFVVRVIVEPKERT